jgi:predicted RNase H-like HicB family nuclease
MNYRITLVESDEGWAVWCDDLPGCCSQGDTRDEATANIREAITEYLDAQPEIEARFGTRIFHEEIVVPQSATAA